ncbi:MAG: glycosyltransferase family 2 protein [Patescibacteria group bacterium]|nr:glycosyltransferase family 2 protein [Patescibacteria group bacterium]MCL5095310.1 glycosyltransferase family 2 protein [Patescibacteria group bacterium]
MISAIILTKNEEKNLEDCLKSLAWCDEIIVVDDYSQDETEKILKKFQVASIKYQVHQRHLDGDFARQRNFGLEKATGEWVLFVDADERVSPTLREEIIKEINDPQNKFNGFFLKRRDFLFGKWLEYGETSKVKLLRLAKRGTGNWQRPVHEIWQVNGPVSTLASPLLHFPHPTVTEFLKDLNFYTDLNAQAFYKEGVKVDFWQIIIYPLIKFMKNYFFLLGFLDGTAGLLQAMFMSFHSFMTRGKLWQLWQKR